MIEEPNNILAVDFIQRLNLSSYFPDVLLFMPIFVDDFLDGEHLIFLRAEVLIHLPKRPFGDKLHHFEVCQFGIFAEIRIILSDEYLFFFIRHLLFV